MSMNRKMIDARVRGAAVKVSTLWPERGTDEGSFAYFRRVLAAVLVIAFIVG